MLPVKAATDFIDMDAGDGRNQALFNYILTLTAKRSNKNVVPLKNTGF